jgi:hypothetical protein
LVKPDPEISKTEVLPISYTGQRTMARIKTNIGVIHGSGPARNLRIRLFFRRFTGVATAAVFIIVLFFIQT